MNLNKIGHKDIFTDYSKLRNTIDEGGVNLGKKQKYGFLSTAYRLKQELSLSANPVECRAKKYVLNEYIIQIQKDLNDGEFNSASTQNNLIKQLKSTTDNDKVKVKVEEFVNAVVNLAKHNTNSNTKINWLGVTNKTAHIELLLHSKNCEHYLDNNKSKYCLEHKKNVINVNNREPKNQALAHVIDKETAANNLAQLFGNLHEATQKKDVLYSREFSIWADNCLTISNYFRNNKDFTNIESDLFEKLKAIKCKSSTSNANRYNNLYDYLYFMLTEKCLNEDCSFNNLEKTYNGWNNTEKQQDFYNHFKNFYNNNKKTFLDAINNLSAFSPMRQ